MTARAARAARAPTVVLIEDREDLRYVLSAVLEHGGMRTRAFRDGVEGLRAVRRERPELVITDLMLPGPSGVEVARSLTAPDGSRPMPILLITAHREAVRDDEVETLFDAVLTKPVDPAELVAVARSLVAATP